MLTACQKVKYTEPANKALSSVQNLNVQMDVRNITFTWEEAAGTEEVYIYRNGRLVETLKAGVKTYFVFREIANEDVLYTFKVRKGDMVSEGLTKTIHIDYNGNAGVSLLTLASPTEQEQKVLTWFKEQYVATGKGQVITPEQLMGITLDGSSTINPDRYSTIWLALDGRETLPEEFDEDVISSIRTFLVGEGKLYLTGAAFELLTPMLRLEESQMPEAVDNSTIEGTGDWGLNCYMHKKLDYRTHEYFAGLVNENGKLPLQNSTKRSTVNYLWNIGGAASMNSWNNEVYGYMYATIASDADAQYGGLAYLEKFGCADGVVLNGCILVNILPGYQWVEGNTYQNNIEKLTSNILESLRIVK